jgi:hypothetical protein
MLRKLSLNLVFYTLILLGLSGSGFADQNNTDSKTDAASRSASSRVKDETMNGFIKGVNSGATHMLIVWDTWDFEDSYSFEVYSYPEQNVNDLIKYYSAPGFYRVSAVYAMHLNFDDQFNGSRWHPEYP